MNQSLLRLAIIAFPMLLGGCVAVWGSAYQVESQTPETMVIQYDTNFIDDAEIEKLASDHCHAYGKSALLQAHDRNMWNISTDDFLCQDPAPKPVAAPK